MRRKENELTTREKEVLKHIALPNNVIAERLFVSPATIRTHLQKIYKKLKTNDKAVAILTAVEKGILKNEDFVR